MTPELKEIERRIVEAIVTFERLPDHERKYLDGLRSQHPDVLPGRWDYISATTPPKLMPTARQISEAHQAISWLYFLSEAQRRFVLACITTMTRGRESVDWKAVTRKFGWRNIHRNTPPKRYRKALGIIACNIGRAAA